jgi:MSHA biogenesis protein MshO
MMRRNARYSRGFTLVELIVVVVIAGIIAGVVGVFIVQPVQSFVDLDRRAGLTDTADTALRLMAREIRAALPNSVRVSAQGVAWTNTVELISAVDAGRYRINSATPNGELRVAAPDRQFDLVGPFYQTAALPGGARLVVYNTGAAPFDAYTAAGDAANMTASNNAIALGAIGTGENAGEQHITLTRPHTFPAGSPNRRIFLVNGPVIYTCSGGTLTRYAGHGYTAATVVPPAGVGWVASTAATGATCVFTYNPGTGTRSGMLSIRLTLTDGVEAVTLLRQVKVDNVP